VDKTSAHMYSTWLLITVQVNSTVGNSEEEAASYSFKCTFTSNGCNWCCWWRVFWVHIRWRCRTWWHSQHHIGW